MAKTKQSVDKLENKDRAQELPGRTTKYDYVLEWIKESNEARRAQNRLVERAIRAYQGQPSANRYKRTINGYVESLRKVNELKSKELQAACSDLPEKGSLVVQNAVDAIVSMAMGGVGQYQFGPYDPDTKSDARLMDRLAAAAKSFYNRNKVDSVLPQYIRNAALSGAGWMHLKQKNGKKIITLLETSQMITDPKRAKTNYERFVGFTQRESFKAVKSRVRKTKGGGYVLKTLNDAEVYVTQIREEMNSVLQGDSTNAFLHEELRRDLDTFYLPIVTRIKEQREQDNPNKMYDGDEVEMSYIYDELNDMYFEIVNRRYIILAKQHDLKREIKCHYRDSKGERKSKTKTVKLDHPFIELPFRKTFWDTYPTTPLFELLDDFDDLCAMESVLYHNISIQAPLTFIGQSSDAEKVSRAASISGETIEGLPQTFGVLNKTHDNGPLLLLIQRYEERIKRTMKAVDPFELQAMLGDRATAKEVVSASGQVSQGINPFLANIETAMATLGDKFIKLELIMNDDDTYSFDHNGKYYEVTREELAGDNEVTAKLISSIKLEQEANSRKALELIQYLNGSEAIDKKLFLGTMLPIVLGTLVTREQSQNMVQEAYRPMPDEVIEAIKRKAEADAKKDEADKLDLSGYGDDEIERMTLELAALQDGGEAPLVPDSQGVDPATGQPLVPAPAAPMPAGNPAIPVAPVAAGGIPGSPEMAGVVANDQVGGGYV